MGSKNQEVSKSFLNRILNVPFGIVLCIIGFIIPFLNLFGLQVIVTSLVLGVCGLFFGLLADHAIDDYRKKDR